MGTRFRLLWPGYIFDPNEIDEPVKELTGVLFIIGVYVFGLSSYDKEAFGFGTAHAKKISLLKENVKNISFGKKQ